MTDVIKIALERRAQLSAELARLDEFIRMAEHLVQEDNSSGRAPARGPGVETVVPATPQAEPAEEDDQLRVNSRPMVFRQKSAG